MTTNLFFIDSFLESAALFMIVLTIPFVQYLLSTSRNHGRSSRCQWHSVASLVLVGVENTSSLNGANKPRGTIRWYGNDTIILVALVLFVPLYVTFVKKKEDDNSFLMQQQLQELQRTCTSKWGK